MFTPDQMQQLSSLVTDAASILLIFPSKASFDVQASVCAMAQSLAQGRDVQVVTPDLQAFDQSIFSGTQVRDELGNKTLQVSFPYTPEKVDKVSYNIDDDNQRFFLTIQPQKGVKPLDHHELEFAYVGADADLIILMGVSNYESLEQLYFGYEDMFKDTTVVSLNTYETAVGTVKLNATGMSSLSEAVARLIQQLQLPLSSEAATHLLSGIEQSTQNLSSLSATADTFETVALLLRQGARRIKRTPTVMQQSPAALPQPKESGLPDGESFSAKLENAKKKKSKGKTITLNEDKVKTLAL